MTVIHRGQAEAQSVVWVQAGYHFVRRVFDLREVFYSYVISFYKNKARLKLGSK